MPRLSWVFGVLLKASWDSSARRLTVEITRFDALGFILARDHTALAMAADVPAAASSYFSSPARFNFVVTI